MDETRLVQMLDVVMQSLHGIDKSLNTLANVAQAQELRLRSQQPSHEGFWLIIARNSENGAVTFWDYADQGWTDQFEGATEFTDAEHREVIANNSTPTEGQWVWVST